MKQLIDFLAEIAARISTESPELFKKMAWVSGILTSLIGLALGVNSFFSLGWGLIVVYKSITLTSLLSGIGAVLTGVFSSSFLPVKDSTALEKKLNPNN